MKYNPLGESTPFSLLLRVVAIQRIPRNPAAMSQYSWFCEECAATDPMSCSCSTRPPSPFEYPTRSQSRLHSLPSYAPLPQQLAAHDYPGPTVASTSRFQAGVFAGPHPAPAPVYQPVPQHRYCKFAVPNTLPRALTFMQPFRRPSQSL